jgi:hypothetical protein
MRASGEARTAPSPAGLWLGFGFAVGKRGSEVLGPGTSLMTTIATGIRRAAGDRTGLTVQWPACSLALPKIHRDDDRREA